MNFEAQGRRKGLIRAATLACCLLGVLNPAMSHAAAGDDLFAQGVRAFKEGNFSVAADLFQRARTEGVDTPALFYNLGASLYKLERYADAEQAFRLCANDPTWASLAYYNIGLAAYQRGDHTLAADYFERAWRTTDNDDVRALALTMLDRLDTTIRNRARGSVALNVGRNDNVMLAADDRVLGTTEEADWFADLYASATGQWGVRPNAPYWNASFYNINYAHLSQNNTSELTLAAGRPGSFDAWRTDVRARYQYVLLRGRALEQIAAVRVKGTRDLAEGRELYLRAELSAIDTLDEDFDFLDGMRQEIDVSTSHRLGDGRVEWGATLEHNNRRDLDTGAEFLSYSPTRYGVWAWGTWPAGGRWRMESTLRYRLGRYADPERRGGTAVGTREDGEFEATLRIRYRLSPIWHVVGEYNVTDNNSNFNEFAYTQRILSLGITRSL
jgi:tetratricopeptide (TPR) repeat protein